MAKLGFKFYYFDGNMTEKDFIVSPEVEFRIGLSPTGGYTFDITNTGIPCLDLLYLPNSPLGKIQIIFNDKMVKELNGITSSYYKYFLTATGLLETIHCDLNYESR